MTDGVKVVVPDSLDLITPYVLREQQDWFEDEIKLVRRLLRPGQTAVDIGANYGLYTLSIANIVGPSGHVWAFEPATATAAMLAESLSINGFDNVTLEQSAVSNSAGTARLSVHSQSELNTLVRDEDPAHLTESVRVVTLDEYSQLQDRRTIDFVKIDAEGEEINILEGGSRFFASCSPLVQYEVKEGQQTHLHLVHAFARMGYDSYRLVPGLDALAPFHPDKPVDRYLLNLFACKRDRAAQLAADGWLVEPAAQPASPDTAADWRSTLATLPYGHRLGPLWEKSTAGDDAERVDQALDLYARSTDTDRPIAERFDALEQSYRRMKPLAESSPTHPRLASLARIAADYGARVVAIHTLAELCTRITRDRRANVAEPFLAPGKRFDSVDPGGDLGNWLLIAAAEELERLKAFSSFYTGNSSRDRLEVICRSAFAGPEMQRRLDLVQRRFGAAGGVEPNAEPLP